MENLKQILSNNNLQIKINDISAESTDQQLTILFVEDTVLHKDYILYVINDNNINNKKYIEFLNFLKKDQSVFNKYLIKIAPRIIRNISQDEFTLIMFESSKTTLKEHIFGEFLFETIIGLLLQYLENLQRIVDQGYFISFSNSTNLRIREDGSLFIMRFQISKIEENENQKMTGEIKQFFDHMIKIVEERSNIDLQNSNYQEGKDCLEGAIINFLKIISSKIFSNCDDIKLLLSQLQNEIIVQLTNQKESIEKRINELKSGNQFDRVLKLQRLLILISPKDYLSYYQIGLTYLQLKQIDLALSNLKKAIELNSSFDLGYNEIGIIYLFQLMEIDPATFYFEKAIESNEKNADAYYYLGYCYLNKGQSDKSIPLYEKCIEINTSHAPALLDLGWQNYLLGNIDKAIEYYDKSLKFDRSIDSTLFNTVNCLYILNRQDEAQYFVEQIQSLTELVQYTHRLIVLDPLNSFLYHDLGVINLLIGDFNKALIAFKKCLEIKPDYIYREFLSKQIDMIKNII